MVDRLIDQPVCFVPAGGASVQLANELLRASVDATAEQLREEVVVAPPATIVVERDDEQIDPFARFEQFLSAGVAGDRIAQRSRESMEDGGRQQELAQERGLPIEHFLGEVVEYESVAAGERRDERRDVVTPVERQRCELEPDGPALGAVGA